MLTELFLNIWYSLFSWLDTLLSFLRLLFKDLIDIMLSRWLMVDLER
jgi:hypothetical protein